MNERFTKIAEKVNELPLSVKKLGRVAIVGAMLLPAIITGCGQADEAVETTPITQIDFSRASQDDAEQFVKVVSAVSKFKEAQKDPDTRLRKGVNDLYSNYDDPLQDIEFGSGIWQDLTGWMGITSGDQEEVTEINSRDEVEKVVRDRAYEMTSVENNPEDAVEIAKRYIDDKGNVTAEAVIGQIATIQAKSQE